MNIVILFHRVNENILIMTNFKTIKMLRMPVIRQNNYKIKLILHSRLRKFIHLETRTTGTLIRL